MHTTKDRTMMNLKSIPKMSNQELMKHALVSLRHHCQCKTCFCCKAKAEWRRRKQIEMSKTVIKKERA